MKRDNVVEWKMQKEVKRRLCGIAGAFERLSGSISSFASPWTGMEQAQLTKMFDEISMPICSECSQCGASGKKMKDIFSCDTCGLELPERINTARNVLKRGKESKT